MKLIQTGWVEVLKAVWEFKTTLQSLCPEYRSSYNGQKALCVS